MSEQFLRIQINNKEPIDLNILSISLNAYASQYDSFLQKKGVICKKSDRRLLVNEIKKGSIIIDIIAPMLPITPDLFNELQNFNSIVEFGYYLKDAIDFFTKKGEKKYDYSKKDCQDHINSLEVVARDTNGGVSLNIMNNTGTVFAPVYVINTNDANASQMIAKKYQEELNDNNTNESFIDKTLKLIITNNNTINGIIEEYSEKPIKLYISDEIKTHIMNDKNTNPFNIL